MSCSLACAVCTRSERSPPCSTPLPHLVFAAVLFGVPGLIATVPRLARDEDADAGAPTLRWSNLLFRAGADEPGVSTGPALAAVSSLGYLGFLAGPPLIGGVASLTSLRFATGLLVLAGLLVVVLAPTASPPRPRPGASTQASLMT